MSEFGSDSDGGRALASARRRFIRDHHPDRGGDPRAFVDGITAFDAARRARERPVTVTVVRRPRGVRRVVHPLLTRLRRRREPPRVR